jgi:hypothetical protein
MKISVFGYSFQFLTRFKNKQILSTYLNTNSLIGYIIISMLLFSLTEAIVLHTPNSNMQYMFSRCVVCGSAYLMGLYVYLLQVPIEFARLIALDTAFYKNMNIFMYFVKYIPFLKYFKYNCRHKQVPHLTK